MSKLPKRYFHPSDTRQPTAVIIRTGYHRNIKIYTIDVRHCIIKVGKLQIITLFNNANKILGI